MWKFKSCPKCSGDMLFDRDPDGWYQLCLQCGFRCGLPDEARVQHEAKPAKLAKKV